MAATASGSRRIQATSGLGRLGRREDDVDGAVGPPGRFVAVDTADDALGVAPVVGPP